MLPLPLPLTLPLGLDWVHHPAGATLSPATVTIR
jgi:hypothetical protein